ncbi:MAG: hypothetical protein J5640_06445 [Bacteroidales bacterium]|nr:hypothetical protein [Bacteroidales bacterium]
MKIIVESGATKSDWRITGEGADSSRGRLFPGMNVSTMPLDHVLEVLTGALDSLGRPGLEGIYLYVAGIVTPAIREALEGRIRECVKVGEIDIQNDLVAAARAVCGRSEGIVAILGTGSNTCFYDGATVSQKVRSGGYIIGDEGGGACLGKLFLADFIKGLVPDEVASDFASRYDASYAGIVENVYRSPAPAGFLGSLAPFILSHYGNPYVKSLVDGNFQSFVDRALRHYDTGRYPVGVVGGFGYACRDIFSRICAENGLRLGSFEAAPINGLLKYHD